MFQASQRYTIRPYLKKERGGRVQEELERQHSALEELLDGCYFSYIIVFKKKVGGHLGSRDWWISELEASLVFRACSRIARATQRSSVSKKQEQQQKVKVQWSLVG